MSKGELARDLRGLPIQVMGHDDSDIIAVASGTDETFTPLEVGATYELSLTGGLAADTATLYMPSGGSNGFKIAVGRGREFQFKATSTGMRVTATTAMSMFMRKLV